MTGVDSRLDLIVAALLLSTGALLVLAGRRRS
jgi:LPXTG-motif cell wall-anchored protein